MKVRGDRAGNDFAKLRKSSRRKETRLLVAKGVGPGEGKIVGRFPYYDHPATISVAIDAALFEVTNAPCMEFFWGVVVLEREPLPDGGGHHKSKSKV